ncbi:MAG: hypothetical protein AABX37_04575 [Nanoarchaeota archaeon]
MLAQNDVTSLLSTYDLPVPTAERIKKIVVRELEGGYYSGFNAVYDRVTALVDQFTVPREECLLSVPGQKLVMDRFSFHQGFFGDGMGIKSQQAEERLTVVEALDLLLKKLDPLQRTVLEHLVGKSGKQERERYEDHKEACDEAYFLVHRLPVEVVEHPEVLMSRLDQLVRTYTDGKGNVLIPHRPIHYVRWSPELWVRYGRRKFNGNPLQFFQDNIEVYGRFETQLALRRFDSGLGAALQRAGQFHEAIPPVKNRERQLTPEEDAEIVNMYHAHQRSVRAIGRNLSFTAGEVVIKRCLRGNGLELRKPREQLLLPLEEQTEIRDALLLYGSGYEASQHLSYSTATILKYGGLMGVPIRKPGSRVHASNLSAEQLKSIDDAFQSCNGSRRKAAQLLGHTRRAIGKRWKEQGYLF